MSNSWHDEMRRFREAKRWPKVLLWAGAAFLLAGLFTEQFLGMAAGLIALGAAGYWMQDILALGEPRSVIVDHLPGDQYPPR
jgi:hypothetical protein